MSLDSWVRVPLPALRMWVLLQKGIRISRENLSLIQKVIEAWFCNNHKIEENNLFSSSNTEELERKIDSITTGLSRPYFNKILKELVKKNLENTIIICDYIIAEQIEINIQNSTKESKIKVLTWLSNHFQDEKSFRNMTKHDILDFLNKLRKPAVEDPVSKWIGSYNGRQIILTKFFRWLYNPDEPDHRNRITPHVCKV